MTTIEHLIRDSNKGKFGKAIRKAVGIAGIAAITAGTVGQSTEAFSQTKDDVPKDTIAMLSHYKDSVFTQKDPKDKTVIHQYEVWSKNTDTISLNFSEIRKEIKDGKPIQFFIVRAETSFDPDKEISSLDGRLVSYSPYIHIESFEVKHAYGANATKFKIKITNEGKESVSGVAPPWFFAFVSDTAILKDIMKDPDLYMWTNRKNRNDIDNWDSQNDYITFGGQTNRFITYEGMNKLILFINKREAELNKKINNKYK